jgi:aspartyl/asparaginyl beta-hydroxylase (cupin superfamily)
VCRHGLCGVFDTGLYRQLTGVAQWVVCVAMAAGAAHNVLRIKVLNTV